MNRSTNLIALGVLVAVGCNDGGESEGAGGEGNASRGSAVSAEPVTFEVTLANVSSGSDVESPIGPGVLVIHEDGMPLFTVGELDRGLGLEALSEDGDPSVLATALSDAGATTFDAGGASYADGSALPGGTMTFTFQATPGQRMSFACMVVESNDYFVGTADVGFALFDDAGQPVQGTVDVSVWDAGTEVDQPLGEGPDQGPRQSAHDTGADEEAPVEKVDFPVDELVIVAISPQP